jgi:hypothetical protein
MTKKKNTDPVIIGLSRAAMDVVTERARQQLHQPPEGVRPGLGYGEAYTPRWDDDMNGDSEMAKAAAVYAYGATYPEAARKAMLQQAHAGRTTRIFEMWPASWDFVHYKPTTARRDLVKAGALILAEIERLDRAEVKANIEWAERVAADHALTDEYGDAT